MNLAIGGMSYVYTKPFQAASLGLLILGPLYTISLIAAVIGVILSLMLWRSWPLLVLLFLTALMIVEVLAEPGSVSFYNTVPVVYGLATVGFCLIWYLRTRARYTASRSDGAGHESTT